MANPYQHEFVRDNDGVVEHCVFTSDINGYVTVHLDVMTEMLRALHFRPVDTVGPDVLKSDNDQTLSTPTSTAR